jgi:hypothetical protein
MARAALLGILFAVAAAPERSAIPENVVHRALGFEETERVVFFRRKLA